ncbi:hypothetical protein CEY16_07170 [Halalkalibacillus sediminis]|uniref:SnoaL-like domain-containing protein n=1 Tax=Halalkalibacillus sediminis TaxID=2018042 RepID=A0A2I0QTM8_9BACI|nr:hypothetical protein [Halalkalibacillus sediminis]PKR77705.1 hypothetical protein CEY16_07170 [Halalkalibacillus sediminis]
MRGLSRFMDVHDRYILKWQQALDSGDASSLDFMADEYYVTFFWGEDNRPVYYERQEAFDGMIQSVSQLRGAKKLFEHRVIRMRDDDHAVVFFEQIIQMGNRVLARMLTVENWAIIENQWLMTREVEEHL